MSRLQVAYLADTLYADLTTGITRYTMELAEALKQRTELDLRLVTLISAETVAARAQERGYPQAQSVPLLLPRSVHYLLWHFARISGPQKAAALDADLLHTPTFLIPPQAKAPLVVTVHDLTLLRFPQHFARNTRILLGAGLRRAVRDASVFLAVSEYTKQDLVRLTGVSPKRVYVTPEAADARFKPVSDRSALTRLEIHAPYVLYVGMLEPRKNLEVLLRAFATLGNRNLNLVLAGAKGLRFAALLELIQELKIAGQVCIPGYVADEDLPVLYSHAQVFVYPSLFEGFGLPILEAMQCGAPVITTNSSSLPEVAGNAALLFQSADVSGLSQALRHVLTEPGVREDMIGLSLERAAQFSWRHTADLTAEAYRVAAKQQHKQRS